MDSSRIIAHMRATDRWTAIDELISQLILSGQIDAAHRDEISAAVLTRERTRSTGIGASIAIPHARTPLVGEVVWAFGRSKAGIEFDAYDKQPVKFVLLFLVPEAQSQKHLNTLARIAKVFHGDQVLRDLAVAADAAAISRVLQGRLN